MIRAASWLPIGLLLLLVALTFWLNRLTQPEGLLNDGSQRHDPDLIVENFTARKLGRDGTLRYTLVARKMTHYPDDDSSVLETVSFEAVNPGEQPVSATSERGKLLNGGDKAIMEGNVVIKTDATNASPAWRLTTPQLILLPDENLAQSDAGIHLQSADGTLTAASFVLNTETRMLTMKQIKAVYQSPHP
jgi:lipopolysaccharide export system protein LptC